MQKSAVQNSPGRKRVNPRTLAMTAILGAVATVLMFLSFSLPVIPSFVKLDFSELPALIAAFSMGPASGVAVCFMKNLINLAMSSTGGVGELCNFLMGVTFVVPAGLFYKLRKDRWGALWGSLLGAVVMAAMSFPINYFITYPFYTAYHVPPGSHFGAVPGHQPGGGEPGPGPAVVQLSLHPVQGPVRCSDHLFGLQENFPPHPRKGGLKRRCRLYFLTPSLPYSIL